MGDRKGVHLYTIVTSLPPLPPSGPIMSTTEILIVSDYLTLSVVHPCRPTHTPAFTRYMEHLTQLCGKISGKKAGEAYQA